MQLYDKDLLSVQEVRELVAAAKKAQQELAGKTQAHVDRIVHSIANAGVRNAQRLAEMAVEETGFGIVDDKVIKNIFASRMVYERVKDLKTIGEVARDDTLSVRTYAVPMGVVAGLIPSTNPTSTALFKAIIAVKAGNAIVFSPHPNAQRCILQTVKVIRQAIIEAGGNEDLVCCITIPTIQATENLLRHPDTAMILATGGAAMVRAAYSSGTPAIGVGPGNGPSFIERSADLPKAVSRILESKTFDNGTICSSEQSVICETDMKDAVKAELIRQGAYFLTPEQAKKLGKFILRGDGTMNPQIVGRSVQVIARLAEIDVPPLTRVLIAEENGVGRGHPYSNEKLAPILAFYCEDTFEKVCERCQEILHYEGAGHTMTIHTQDQEKVDYFARNVPVSRIVVNSPGSLGGVGGTTGLFPSMTLGCGAIGGSATSDNVGPMNLLNYRHVAYGIREVSEIRADVPECPDGICRTEIFPSVDVEEIVRKVIARLQLT